MEAEFLGRRSLVTHHGVHQNGSCVQLIKRLLACTGRGACRNWVMAGTLLFADRAGAVVPYSVKLLGDLGLNANHTASSQGMDINSSGVTVGYATKHVNATYYGDRAVRWDLSGSATELQVINTDLSGFSKSYAVGINDAGAVVGNAFKFSGNTYLGTWATRWAAGQTSITQLDTLGLSATGGTDAWATSINASGQAVGTSKKYVDGVDMGYRPVRWDANSTAVTELGTFGTDPTGMVEIATANSINNSGLIVGSVSKYDGAAKVGYRASRWDPGSNVAVELGNLGHDVFGESRSSALSVNNKGDIVGYVFKYDAAGQFAGRKPVLWAAGTSDPVELVDLTGLNGSATSINDARDIVGTYSLTPQGAFTDLRGVLWQHDISNPIDLNSLLPANSPWVLNDPTAINNNGVIVGIGTYGPDKKMRAFRLDPVAGDTNYDGIVDRADLAVMAAHYGQSGTRDDGDLNGDGLVGFSDFQILESHFGKPAAAPLITPIDNLGESEVPEPCCLMVLAGLLLLNSRRVRA